jgi:Carboxypeptidase regulatory-like domain
MRFLLLLTVCSASFAASSVTGELTDPQGKPAVGATVRLEEKAQSNYRSTITGPDGRFAFDTVPAGKYRVAASAPGFANIGHTVTVSGAQDVAVNLRFDRLAAHVDSVTVTADVTQQSVQQPDPAQRVMVREEILDANPGRPGAPVSIPGLPIETASSGIKAPQYFAPGVAGDHGEPIATFFQVGSYLLPNNLSANAHGNGYSDPNVLVPALIEAVQTDGGSFNVREGNHSVDLSETYLLRPALMPFATLTADARDADLSAGWNWLAIQASYGNGFLDTLEHRQQYKANVVKNWALHDHELSLLFLGYYGESRIPGLVPVGVPDLHDTIDRRQRDQTHTSELAVNDTWHPDNATELQLSTFFRTYNLALDSNFGDGLIRQSEFRTENGANASYVRQIGRRISIMAGFDFLREAPRRDDLDRYASTDQSIYGPLERVTANNITLNLLTPYVAVQGDITRWLHFNLGWRRDQIAFDNIDLMLQANAFHRWIGVNSPKATLSAFAPDRLPLPNIAVSFGESFFTNDPRIGTGSGEGSLVSRAHSYQVVLSKTVAKTDLRVTAGRVTQEASLAKIDPDTGLQFNEGPSRNRYITASARRLFRWGLLQGSVSKADARDLSDGTPVPEAPRLILDFLTTFDRLPFGLHARAEVEEVGHKPLGDGFVSVPVREFRGALARSFYNERLEAGVHFQIASGYTGQTTEVLALPGESEAFERVTGVYTPSYATVSLTWRFGR